MRMDEERIAEAMAALGSVARLRIFRLLVRAGEPGFTVGTVQRRTGMPASTLAHHLDALERAGLMQRRRSGREVRCVVCFPFVRELMDHLVAACCSEREPETVRAEAKT